MMCTVCASVCITCYIADLSLIAGCHLGLVWFVLWKRCGVYEVSLIQRQGVDGAAETGSRQARSDGDRQGPAGEKMNCNCVFQSARWPHCWMVAYGYCSTSVTHIGHSMFQPCWGMMHQKSAVFLAHKMWGVLHCQFSGSVFSYGTSGLSVCYRRHFAVIEQDKGGGGQV